MLKAAAVAAKENTKSNKELRTVTKELKAIVEVLTENIQDLTNISSQHASDSSANEQDINELGSGEWAWEE